MLVETPGALRRVAGNDVDLLVVNEVVVRIRRKLVQKLLHIGDLLGRNTGRGQRTDPEPLQPGETVQGGDIRYAGTVQIVAGVDVGLRRAADVQMAKTGEVGKRRQVGDIGGVDLQVLKLVAVGQRRDIADIVDGKKILKK